VAPCSVHEVAWWRPGALLHTGLARGCERRGGNWRFFCFHSDIN
jgi:hypothetical protein